MKVFELKTDIIIIDWFKHVRAKPHTQEAYLQCMQEYTNFTDMSPIELIEEAEAEIEARIKPRKQKIKTRITGFREYLKNKNLAPLSVENRITGVRSFYKSNDIIIPELQRRENAASVLEVHKGVPTKDDVMKVLSLADPLEKAIILTGLSSGLAVNEICDLKISDFRKGFDPETGITTLSLRREKKQVDFVTFLTPEASSSINEYLIYRERKPKNGKEESAIPLRKQRIVSDSGYLFIKRSIDNEYLESGNEELRAIPDNAIQEMYRQLCISAGMCSNSGVWNLFRSHNMRKYFNNRLIAAKCDPMLKEFMMGHKIPNKTQASYFVADPIELKELYKEFVPYLTIETQFDYSGSPEYLEMKEQISKLQSEKDNLFNEMRAELDKLKQLGDSREKAVNEFLTEFKDPAKRQKLIETRQGVVMNEADAQRLMTDETTAAICATLTALEIRQDADYRAEQERKESVVRLGKTLDELLSD